jgi:hypothetical protein
VLVLVLLLPPLLPLLIPPVAAATADASRSVAGLFTAAPTCAKKLARRGWGTALLGDPAALAAPARDPAAARLVPTL